MEWMLQVVDEIDDAVGAVRHRWLGLSAEIGTVLAGGFAVLGLVAAFAAARESGVICAGAAMVGFGFFAKQRPARPRP